MNVLSAFLFGSYAAYPEARSEFLARVKEFASTEIKHFEFRVGVEDDIPLVADAVYIPPTVVPRRLLIISSGVHGAEAPFGSLLQREFLTHIRENKRAEFTGVLFIHALNPYGFYKGRRVTAANVDLNRNFFSSKSTQQAASNENYFKYKNLLSPRASVSNLWAERARIFFGLLGVAMGGARAENIFTHAFASGQYEDEKGVYYGGAGAEPQVEWMATLLKSLMSSYEEIVLYDIHTGLGKKNALQLISSLKTKIDSGLSQELREEILETPDLSFVSPRSEGFYVTTGDFIDFVYDLTLPHQKIAAFTAEFGTIGDSPISKMKTAMRIILENQAHHHGTGNPAMAHEIKKDFVELFSPPSREWIKKSLSLGIGVMSKTYQQKLPDLYKKAQ